MSQIFKIKHIHENKLHKVFIFTADDSINKGNLGPSENAILTDLELKEIQETGADINLVRININSDDSIIEIKKK